MLMSLAVCEADVMGQCQLDPNHRTVESEGKARSSNEWTATGMGR
jgi:hypothetical protein